MSDVSYDFSGKTALVTGGATGIGRATAKAFAANGAKVMIGDIDPRAEETVAIIHQAGGEADFTPTDVTDGAAVRALVEKTVGRFGGLHMAFNNAGIEMRNKPVHELTADDIAAVLGVDLVGVFYCIKHEFLAMKDAGGGNVTPLQPSINVASNICIVVK